MFRLQSTLNRESGLTERDEAMRQVSENDGAGVLGGQEESRVRERPLQFLVAQKAGMR